MRPWSRSMRMYGREKSEVVKPTNAVSVDQEDVQRIDEELLVQRHDRARSKRPRA